MLPLRRWKRNSIPDQQTRKQKVASRRAGKFLVAAKKHSPDKPKFYEALEAALHNFLKSKFKIETTDFNKQRIQALLEEKNIDKTMVADFVRLLQNCEQARYSPSTEVQIQNDYEAAVKTITQIDRML